MKSGRSTRYASLAWKYSSSGGSSQEMGAPAGGVTISGVAAHGASYPTPMASRTRARVSEATARARAQPASTISATRPGRLS